jgi:hypothetical protein
MTTNIRIKKSSVPGNIPSPELLEYGEIAINFADGKLYYKNSLNEVKAFIDSDAVVNLMGAINSPLNIHDSDTGIVASGHLVPDGDAIYDLGSPTRKWRDLHLSSNTLYLASVSLGFENNSFTVKDSQGQVAQINQASISSSVTGLIDSAYIAARLGTVDLSAISQDILPATDVAYDLGSPTHKFKSLYLSGNTIYMDGTTISASDEGIVVRNALGATIAELARTVDSNFLASVIDSNYVISRQIPQDLEFSSLINTPEFFDGNYNSLANRPTIIDSSTVRSLLTAAGGIDSATVVSIVDSRIPTNTAQGLDFGSIASPAGFSLDLGGI